MKKAIKLLALTALVFSTVGCGNNTSTDSTSTADTTSSTFAITTSDKKTAYTVEKGEEFTIKFNVTSTDADAVKTLDFTLEVENENKPTVASASKHSSIVLNTGVFAKLYACRIGTCKLIAAATADPTQKIEITITVKEALPDLASTWANLNTMTNYTMNITRGAKTSEMTSKGYDEDTRIPVKQIKVTEDAVIVNKASSESEDAQYTAPVYTYSSGDKVLGIVADKDGYVSSLTQSSTGSYSFGKRLVGMNGYIKKANIAGAGDSLTSPNGIISDYYGTSSFDVFYESFGGYQDINSAWWSDITKEHDNEYEVSYKIEDEEGNITTSTNVAYAEVALWSMIDYNGLQTYLATASDSSFTAIADQISDLIITVNSANSVDITATIENVTYYVTLDEDSVGKTEIASEIKTFALSNTATPLALNESSSLAQIVNNINSYNYYSTISSSSSSSYKYTIYLFTYGNYVFQYADAESIAQYNAYRKSLGYTTTFKNTGYVFTNDNEIRSFTFTDATAAEGETPATEASVTISDTALKLDDNGTTTCTKDQFQYLMSYAGLNDGLAFNDLFNLDTGLIFTMITDSSTGSYYTRSTTACDAVAETFIGMTLDEYATKYSETLLYKYFSMTPTTKNIGTEDEPNNVTGGFSWFLGAFQSDGNYVSGFGGTVGFYTNLDNQFHTIIENAIENFSATVA